MPNQSYDHMAGNPLDVKDHPDNILPDTGIPGQPVSDAQIMNRKTSDSIKMYNALSSLYKKETN